MKSEGRLNGTRSKRWLGAALVLGAALAVLPAMPAPAAGENVPASGGKNKPCTECVDSFAFEDSGPGTPITVFDPSNPVPRWVTPGEPLIFCFENRTSCDITITFPKKSPFNRPKIKVKSKGTKGIEFNSKPLNPSGTSTYPFTWAPDSCAVGPKSTLGSAQMIVKP